MYHPRQDRVVPEATPDFNQTGRISKNHRKHDQAHPPEHLNNSPAGHRSDFSAPEGAWRWSARTKRVKTAPGEFGWRKGGGLVDGLGLM